MSVVGFKFIAALQALSPKKAPSNFLRSVIIQVPCYTEGVISISKTLESIADTKYDDQYTQSFYFPRLIQRYKFLFIVCDGVVTGSENDKPTPDIVRDVLGASHHTADMKQFESIGDGSKKTNRGLVYSGMYIYQGHSVNYSIKIRFKYQRFRTF